MVFPPCNQKFHIFERISCVSHVFHCSFFTCSISFTCLCCIIFIVLQSISKSKSSAFNVSLCSMLRFGRCSRESDGGHRLRPLENLPALLFRRSGRRRWPRPSETPRHLPTHLSALLVFLSRRSGGTRQQRKQQTESAASGAAPGHA